MHEARRGIEASGRKLLVLAPTAEAARDVLRKQGFENAETVAKLLFSERLQQEARGAVWWVDEAGLLSVPAMDKLLGLAEQLDARVILVGDISQHHPVERGQAFELLQRFGKMSVASVNEIVRQRGIYKQIVECAEARQTEKLFNLMAEANAIFEGTIEERQKVLASHYVEKALQGKKAWVVAPTHAECRNVTEGIRAKLKQHGTLKGGRQVEILRNLSWTDAQRSDPDHYTTGLVIQINEELPGFSFGEKLEVVAVNENIVNARAGDRIKTLPLSKPKAFGVYRRDSIEVCKGERIRITENGRTADGQPISNGNLFTVERVNRDGEIVLENGWRVAKNFGHVNWGYAMTSISSQGKDVDWIFLAQSPELSHAASNANQVYVSISRGREGMKLYTTDLASLKELAAREQKRVMATELQELKVEAAKVTEIEAGTEIAIAESPVIQRDNNAVEIAPTNLQTVAIPQHPAMVSNMLGGQSKTLPISMEPPKKQIAMEMGM